MSHALPWSRRTDSIWISRKSRDRSRIDYCQWCARSTRDGAAGAAIARDGGRYKRNGGDRRRFGRGQRKLSAWKASPLRLAVAFAGRHGARTVASSSFLSPPWHMSRQGRSEPKDQRLFATAGDKGDFVREPRRRRWNLAAIIAQRSSRCEWISVK